MSPLNGLVLGAAAVVASPALWLTLVEGTLPLTDALLRYLLSVLICWAALNVMAMLVLPEPTPSRVPVSGSEQAPGSESNEAAGLAAEHGELTAEPATTSV